MPLRRLGARALTALVLAACGGDRQAGQADQAAGVIEERGSDTGCGSVRSGAAETAFAAEVAEPIAGVRDAVQRAASGDWTGLEARLATEVVVVRSPGTDTRSMAFLDAGDTMAWLRERWQPGVEIRSTHVVEHHPWVDFCTGPWRAVAPSGAVISLRAHLQRASEGPARWVIDVVLYE